MNVPRIASLLLTAALLCCGLCGCRAGAVSPDMTDRPVGPSGGVTRILVLGCDRAASLTDSILLVTAAPDCGELHVLQLPRDTYAAYTDRAYKKLNGAYAALGAGEVKRFLSRALGVPIDYTAVLNLDCVAALVDAVGGVDLEITQPMQYTDPAQNLRIDLQPGLQHLDGRQAEQFLRYRAGYADADLGRMDAQKRFLQAYLQKCRDLGSADMVRVLLAVLPGVQTDLPLQRAVELARLLPRLGPEALHTATAPGGAVRGRSGAWYYSLNRADMIRTVNSFLLPPSPVTDASFDPDRVFDRQDHPDFHRIYTAPGMAAGAVGAPPLSFVYQKGLHT